VFFANLCSIKGSPSSPFYLCSTKIVEASFQCAGCGQCNQTTVDDSAGRRQSYVEDCQVCCKPNVLHIEYDLAGQEFVIAAELE
jgi:hypothetical protein